MATYKVLQDIEAEDKLLGPLTLKQFIFAIVFLGIGFVEFKLITFTGLSVVRWPIVIALLPVFIVFGFLAAPISRDQPNDVWLLARLRYLVKPHVRIWNQDGLSDLVTINAPKRIEHFFTNGLNQGEVQSRLSALANTLDSRGWATKNVDVNLFAQPGYLSTSDGSDRLVAPSNLPVNVMAADIRAADDMMDERSNPVAQHLDQMVQQSTAAHRQQVKESVQNPYSPPADLNTADYWFLNKPAGPPPTLPVGMSTFDKTTVVAPGMVVENPNVPSAEEQAIIERAEHDKDAEQAYYHNLKTLQPIGATPPTQDMTQPSASTTTQNDAAGDDDDAASILPPVAVLAQQQPVYQPPAPSKPTPNPAIINLANNDDLNVATIARQAKQISEADGEVVISLH